MPYSKTGRKPLGRPGSDPTAVWKCQICEEYVYIRDRGRHLQVKHHIGWSGYFKKHIADQTDRIAKMKSHADLIQLWMNKVFQTDV